MHLLHNLKNNKVNKFIEIEKKNEASINIFFCNELGSLNNDNHLVKRLNFDPDDRYELFVG